MVMVIMPIMVHGATMCSKNDTVTIMLNPQIGGTVFKPQENSSTWWTSFSYGTVHGISACLSSKYGKKQGGTISQLTDTNPNTNESARVVGGEANGKYCWCKMTHPALSLWVFNNEQELASSCASNCAYHCSINVYYISDLRTSLFGSIAQN